MNALSTTLPWYQQIPFILWMLIRNGDLLRIPEQLLLKRLSPRGHQVYSTLKKVDTFLPDGVGSVLKKRFTSDIIAVCFKSTPVTAGPVDYILKLFGQEGELLHKDVVKVILAYGVLRQWVNLNDIRTYTSLAEYAGYKRALNLEQQVNITLMAMVNHQLS